MEGRLLLAISLVLTGMCLGIGLALGEGICRAARKGLSYC